MEYRIFNNKFPSTNKVLPTKEFGGLTFTPYTTLLFNVRDIRDFDGVFSELGGQQDVCCYCRTNRNSPYNKLISSQYGI